MRHVFAIVCALVLASAGCAYESIDAQSCPPDGTQWTYANFGQTFMGSYCNRCHAATSPDRQGAPGEFIFDSLAQVQSHRARIFVRAAGPNDSMPPGPSGPSRVERDQLAEWLACGAPP